MRAPRYGRWVLWAAAGWAAGLVTGCASLPGAAALRVSVHRGRTFVIHEVKGPARWGVGMHPFLCPVSTQRVALTFWVAGDGVYSGTAPLPWPMYTDDGGATWSAGDPFAWAEPPTTDHPLAIAVGEEYQLFNMGYFFSRAVLPDGSRIVHHRHSGIEHHNVEEVEDDEIWLRGLWSEDGKTWRGERRVPLYFPPGIREEPLYWLHCEHPGTVTSDGRILMVGSGRGQTTLLHTTFLFESTDGGKSFTCLSAVARPRDAPWGLEHGPGEPALLALSDRELLCVMRTGTESGGITSGFATADPLLMARSTDGGRTWTVTKLPIPGVSPKLLKMSNGVLVMATGRPVNRLYFSVDGGRTWGRQLPLTVYGQKTSGYCDMIEIKPGRLLVVYDVMSGPARAFWLWEPKEVNNLIGVYVDVAPRF